MLQISGSLVQCMKAFVANLHATRKGTVLQIRAACAQQCKKKAFIAALLATVKG
jgi:hypothetical protein